jgi:hypothetical protein
MARAPHAPMPFSLMLSPETRQLAELSGKFLEDIQYKDFKAAAGYSSPEDREKADIPALIERIFKIKPEQLDINQIEVLSADLDSTGRRARVKLKTEVKLLNTAELRSPEVLLYWKKAPGGQWYMDLASSLQSRHRMARAAGRDPGANGRGRIAGTRPNPRSCRAFAHPRG